ncbi:MAG: altronate dehydratase family protein [Treponema sp.]|jgi:altronate hydrolase|nr:altronate dehydratase family protein [Treponema sp.]
MTAARGAVAGASGAVNGASGAVNGASAGRPPLLRIHGEDTVAVALEPLEKGASLSLDACVLEIREAVPPGHKVALRDIASGERVIKYGYPIGAATADIPAGAWVHTHNLRTLLTETPEYHYQALPAALPSAAALPAALPGTISAYRRKDGQIGIRNELWIIPTVGCVNSAAAALARWADAEFGGSGGSVDGVYAWTHPYGCSQMGADHETTRLILADLAKHPNAAGVLVLSLGCENNTLEGFKAILGSYAADTERMAFLVAQDWEDEIAEGKRLLTALAAQAGKARREAAPLSELIIGMKCGGSDGFSGVSANALLGRICDRLSARGARTILTEVPEMFGAEQMLMDRAESREVFEKTVALIEDFKEYYRSQGQRVYENPSPGNKAGGISTLEDKSCGCVQKGGRSIVRGVYRYGERIPLSQPGGLVLLEGPGNDIVSSTAMTAAGAHLMLFSTGRGTPLGAPVPTIKIASNTDLARRKPRWIDFDAGTLLGGTGGNAEADLLQLILDVVSGAKKTRNEENGCREIGIFKNGVTL